MSAYEIVVPYTLADCPRSLTMRVQATSADEALSIARHRALAVRPLLGHAVRFPCGEPAPMLAPRRAA